jgi:hypothetical protein
MNAEITTQARFIVGDGSLPLHLPMEPEESMLGFADRAAALAVESKSFYAFSRVETAGEEDSLLTRLTVSAISGQRKSALN